MLHQLARSAPSWTLMLGLAVFTGNPADLGTPEFTLEPEVSVDIEPLEIQAAAVVCQEGEVTLDPLKTVLSCEPLSDQEETVAAATGSSFPAFCFLFRWRCKPAW